MHYKFKSALEYDTITFDGLHISVKDLKNSIIQQKRIGKNTDFDLQVTNAQTKEGKRKKVCGTSRVFNAASPQCTRTKRL